MMVKKIFVASTNKGKILEIKELIKSSKLSNLVIETLEGNFIKEPDEPYDSFLENAKHKALYYVEHTKLPTVCDDSGLCIEALNDFPGVKTKNFLEKCGSLNNAFTELEKLLTKHSNRRAYFQTAICLCLADTKRFIISEARSYGYITFPARGTQGFGFDPIFIPEGYTGTLAELGTRIKNQVSHRSEAIKKLIANMEKLFQH
ncbi:MAG: non-canonical purine NTP pyrophosphatase [Alphaproteobacteria bacterium]|jgi:XTP/dITP diphosphohydrolase|nr:non-canonical purine NTP pyrophosphatase [Alphaproteobacteria bacterium]